MFIKNNSRICSLSTWEVSSTFLEECKYVKENIKTNNYIDKELKSESDSDSDNYSDNDSDSDNEE